MEHVENTTDQSNENLSVKPWIAALVFEMLIFVFVIIKAVMLF